MRDCVRLRMEIDPGTDQRRFDVECILGSTTLALYYRLRGEDVDGDYGVHVQMRMISIGLGLEG